MIFPWASQKPKKDNLEADREMLRQLSERRKAAAKEVETTLKKLLETKEPRNGDA